MNRKKEFDVIVIGAGISGMLAALYLSKINMKIVLIEKKKFTIVSDDNDGRAIAITPASALIMKKAGVWGELSKKAEPINHIRVLDNYSSFFLDFDNKYVGDKPLGYIVEAFHIFKTLQQQVSNDKNIEIYDNKNITSIENHANYSVVNFDDQSMVQAKLAIVADGRNSQIRAMLGITSCDYDYKQSAMVLACMHEKHHMNTAIEHFMPTGPFAILPLPGGYRSGIVWTEQTRVSSEYLKMDKNDFESYLNHKFTDYLGKVTLDSKIISYPLTLKFSNQYYKNRFVLIGDAAHAIHPLAGQGLNLGIRDIGLLVELILRNNNVGLDIADQLMLEEYQKIRKLDNSLMIITTHGLDRLFSNNYTLAKPIRKIGLSVVNRFTKLKKIFMHKAMGS